LGAQTKLYTGIPGWLQQRPPVRLFYPAAFLSVGFSYSAWGLPYHRSRPKTATPFVVPTKNLPFTMVGVMNLLPAPNVSRDPDWLLL